MPIWYFHSQSKSEVEFSMFINSPDYWPLKNCSSHDSPHLVWWQHHLSGISSKLYHSLFSLTPHSPPTGNPCFLDLGIASRLWRHGTFCPTVPLRSNQHSHVSPGPTASQVHCAPVSDSFLNSLARAVLLKTVLYSIHCNGSHLNWRWDQSPRYDPYGSRWWASGSVFDFS